MKRLLSLFFVIFLLLPCFASCGESEAAVFTYDGYTITESQYRYWVSNYKTNILKYHGVSDSEAFWKTELTEGVTMEEYYTPIIDGVIKNYCIAQALYRRYKLAISSDVKKAIDNDINEKIEYYGSRSAVNAILASFGLNISGLKQVYLIEEKYNTVYDYLFGNSGIMAASATEVQAYYEKNYNRMMYIVFETNEPVLDKDGNPTYDSSGNVITQPDTKEEIQRKKELLESIKTRAGLGDEDTFAELMEEYSSVDLSGFENGLYVSQNEVSTYGTKIVTALQSLEAGQCEIIEEPGYLFLIRKYALTPFSDLSSSDISTQLMNLESYTSQQLCATMYSELHSDILVNETVKSALTLSKITANTDGNF